MLLLRRRTQAPAAEVSDESAQDSAAVSAAETADESARKTATESAREVADEPDAMSLPFGPFLAAAGVITALWGPAIWAAYLRALGVG
jgi:hypothetical protein